MASKPQPARQIGKQSLLTLVKKTQQTNQRLATERGALGAIYEKAATSENFNATALRPLLPLLKMEPGPQAHLWRTICLYAEHLGIGTQGDLEDAIAASEAGDDGDEEGDDDGDGSETGAEDAGGDPEAVADARALAEEATAEEEPDADPVAAVLGNMDTPAMGRFRTSLQDASTAEAVNKGLERFTADHPELAEQALEAATDRLEEIGREAGGGEDLRSTAQRDAEAQGVADTAHATTGRKPRKPRASTRKDAGAIGQEPAGANLGSEFGGGGRAVH